MEPKWKTVFFKDQESKELMWVFLTFLAEFGKFKAAVKANSPTSIETYNAKGERVINEVGSTMGNTMEESLNSAYALVFGKKK